VVYFCAQSSDNAAQDIISNFLIAEDMGVLYLSKTDVNSDVEKGFKKILQDQKIVLDEKAQGEYCERIVILYGEEDKEQKKAALNVLVEDLTDGVSYAPSEDDLKRLEKGKQRIIQGIEDIRSQKKCFLELLKINIESDEIEKIYTYLLGYDLPKEVPKAKKTAEKGSKEKKPAEKLKDEIVENFKCKTKKDFIEQIDELLRFKLRNKKLGINAPVTEVGLLKEKTKNMVVSLFPKMAEEFRKRFIEGNEVVYQDIIEQNIQQYKLEMPALLREEAQAAIKNAIQDLIDKNVAVKPILTKLFEQALIKDNKYVSVIMTALKSGYSGWVIEPTVVEARDSQELTAVVALPEIRAELSPLEVMLNELNAVFRYILQEDASSWKLKLYYLSGEYLLEHIGSKSEKLSQHEAYQDTSYVEISRRNLLFLSVARKIMAHYPLVLENEVLTHSINQLVLYAKPYFEHYERHIQFSITHVSRNKRGPFQNERSLSLEELQEHQSEIEFLIVGYGFKEDFKIFDTDIGIQADLNFIVEPEGETSNYEPNLLQLELELCHELNANIKVYAKNDLARKLSPKLNHQHVASLVGDSEVLDDYIRRVKLIRIFESGYWSEIVFKNNRVVIRSEYLESEEVSKIMSYLSPRYREDDHKELLFDKDALIQGMKAKFLDIEPNAQLLIEFLELFNEWFWKPAFSNLSVIKLPIVKAAGVIEYEYRSTQSKIIPVPKEHLQLLNKNKNVIQETVQKIRSKAPVDKQNMDVLISVVAVLFMHRKQYIMERLAQVRMLDLKDLKHVASIIYAQPQRELEGERNKEIQFRTFNLKRNKTLENVLRKKARVYIEKVSQEFFRLDPNRKGIIVSLLKIDKIIEHLLSEYYDNNEYQITLQHKLLDPKQREIISEDNFIPNDKNYFCWRARSEPTIIKNEALREKIIELKDKSDNVLRDFCRARVYRITEPNITEKKFGELCTAEYRETYNQWFKLYKPLTYFVTDVEILILLGQGAELDKLYPSMEQDFQLQYLRSGSSKMGFRGKNSKTIEVSDIASDVDRGYTAISLFHSNVVNNLMEHHQLAPTLRAFQDEVESHKGLASTVASKEEGCRNHARPLFLFLDLEYRNLTRRVQGKEKVNYEEQMVKMREGLERLLRDADYFGIRERYYGMDQVVYEDGGEAIKFYARNNRDFSSDDYLRFQTYSSLYVCADSYQLAEECLEIMTGNFRESFIENYADFISKNHLVDMGVMPSVMRLMPFHFKPKSLSELFKVYLWTDVEIKTYADFPKDDQIVREHYQFNAHLYLIKKVEHRLRKINEIIQKTQGTLASHSPNNALLQRKVLEEKLRFYIRYFARCFELQLQYLDEALASPYSIKRMLKQLCEASELLVVFGKIKNFPGGERERNTKFKKWLAVNFCSVRTSAMNELLGNSQLEQLYNYPELNLSQRKVFLEKFKLCDKLDLDELFKLSDCLFPKIMDKTKKQKKHLSYPTLLASMGVREKKMSPSRVLKALEKISKKRGAQVALETADRFCRWAKNSKKSIKLNGIIDFKNDISNKIDRQSKKNVDKKKLTISDEPVVMKQNFLHRFEERDTLRALSVLVFASSSSNNAQALPRAPLIFSFGKTYPVGGPLQLTAPIGSSMNTSEVEMVRSDIETSQSILRRAKKVQKKIRKGFSLDTM
jgi:hypothetical protein